MTRTLALFAALALAGSAQAQARGEPREAETHAEPREPESAEARDAFLAGLHAAEALEWDRALASFERSYALSPTAAALFNAATALRALGRHVDTRHALARLLRDHTLEPDVRTAAERMLEEEDARIATLVLRGLPTDEITVRLDGTRRDDTGERPLSIESDPGERGLTVERPGHEPFFWNGVLADGERRELTVEFAPARAAALAWYERPWVWVAAGGVVIVAALVVVLVATGGTQLEPRTDPVLRP